MIRAGVLSDTHLTRPDNRFKQHLRACFKDCDVLIHAGDITGTDTLDFFADTSLFAVHGNMCAAAVQQRLPDRLLFTLGRYTIGLAHGAGMGQAIEDTLWNLFPEADCIIYGHTHRPTCRWQGPVLFLNPGSFRESSPYGAPGSYAILEVGERLSAQLFQRPPLP